MAEILFAKSISNIKFAFRPASGVRVDPVEFFIDEEMIHLPAEQAKTILCAGTPSGRCGQIASDHL